MGSVSAQVESGTADNIQLLPALATLAPEYPALPDRSWLGVCCFEENRAGEAVERRISSLYPLTGMRLRFAATKKVERKSAKSNAQNL